MNSLLSAQLRALSVPLCAPAAQTHWRLRLLLSRRRPLSPPAARHLQAVTAIRTSLLPVSPPDWEPQEEACQEKYPAARRNIWLQDHMRFLRSLSHTVSLVVHRVRTHRCDSTLGAAVWLHPGPVSARGQPGGKKAGAEKAHERGAEALARCEDVWAREPNEQIYQVLTSC